MKRRYQKGDMGAAMLVVMVVVMLGALFWHGRDGHRMHGGAPGVQRAEKTAQELLDEAYARGEITREEYLCKREDLSNR